MKYNESWPAPKETDAAKGKYPPGTRNSFTVVRAEGGPAACNNASVSFLRKQYPAGTSIQLIAMKDPCSSIHFGMVGRVTFVDDTGQIHVLWENGKTVPVIPGEDRFQAVWRG